MIATIVRYVFQILTVIVIVDVLLSYFTSPYNRIRAFLDRIVEPMLRPIRRIIPPMANIDFSPVILVILLQIIESILVRIL